jgi:hypothetical protein
MATIGPVALTLADWAKRIDDDGKIAEIINLLSQTNEMLYIIPKILFPYVQ